MKIEESVEYMSKMYLERIIKSFTQDYPSNRGEEEYREIVKSNVDTLSDAENLNLVAENRGKYFSDDSFNLHVFNSTEILDWETLRDRMNLFD